MPCRDPASRGIDPSQRAPGTPRRMSLVARPEGIDSRPPNSGEHRDVPEAFANELDVRPSAPTFAENGPRYTTVHAENRARAVLVAALTEAVKNATASGDLEAARVAHDALGKLLSS